MLDNTNNFQIFQTLAEQVLDNNQSENVSKLSSIVPKLPRQIADRENGFPIGLGFISDWTDLFTIFRLRIVGKETSLFYPQLQGQL